MARLLRRLRYWVRQHAHDAALREELESHRALTQQDLEADGLAQADARHMSQRLMGNVMRAREDARAVWIWPWLESVWQDARYAIRALRRQPGVVLLSVAVLGVAIGLNASLFTVFAGAVLRPMDGVADPARLALVSTRVPQRPDLTSGLSLPEFEALAATATTAELAAERTRTVSVDAGNGARDMRAVFVTGNYFDVLGARMAHGRSVLADDDTRGAPARVAVLSHSLWQAQFGGNPAVAGRSIRIAGRPHTVIGVAARGFAGSEGRARVWLPIAALPALRPDDVAPDRPDVCCVEVFARLNPGVTHEQLEAELQVSSDGFRAAAGQDARPIVVGGTQALRGRRGDSAALAAIGVLFLGITTVLLIACANVGNLLLARTVARRGEIGVRLSLGAGRRRVVRQLLTEGLVLTLIATAAGLSIAAWLPPVVLNEVARQPAPFDIGVDALVFAYAIALAAIACVACALAPALHATRGGIGAALKGTAPDWSRLPLRGLLLGAQLALTVVLLTSAGLLLRGIGAARELDPGFRIDGLFEIDIRLPEPEYDADRMRLLLAELPAALRSGGVSPLAFAAPGRATDEARLPGQRPDQSRPVDRLDVSPSYFEVLGIPMAAGRMFVDSDRERGVAVVNETLARRLWPGDSPLGRSFVAGDRTLEVIGVARDARIFGLEPVGPSYFLPITGSRARRGLFPLLLLRPARPSDTAAAAAVVERLEPRAQVTATPMRARLDFELAELVLAPLAASVLGLFALALATVGMFGAFAYAVRQRTREIGIRIALGAPPAMVVRSVLAGSSRALAWGLAAGLVGGVASSQLLRSVLYGLSPLDPVTYGAVALILVASALVATYVPARRAATIDPVKALRE